MADEPKHIELPAPPPIRLTMGAFQIILLAAAIGLTWWLTKKFNSPTQAFSETSSAQLEKLTAEVTQLKGTILEQKALLEKTKQEMGADFNKAVAKQNGTITTLAVAVGQIPGKTAELIPPSQIHTLPGGGFKDLTLEQNRTPALAAVNLTYDPLGKGLSGTWNNYTEKFTARFGEWRTEHDGIRAAVRLTRDVSNGGQPVGKTEEIPLEMGDLFVTPDTINRTIPQPKYTFHIGTSYDQRDGRPSPAVLVGKQFTPNSAVTTGYVNRSWTVLYSFKIPGW